MQNITYLTPIVDGMASQTLQIPKCIQLDDGTYYCFDYRGRLVNVQKNVSEPIVYNIIKTYVKPNRVIAQIDGITPIEPLLEIASTGLEFLYNNAVLSSNNGYFVNEGVQWQGWPSLSIYSGSPTPGTGGAYGSAVTLFNNSSTPRSMIVPLFLSITWGGTFASGETVSVEVNFTIVYGTGSQTTLGTGTLTASATSTGTQNFGCKEIYAVIAPYLNSNYNYGPGGSYNNQYISQITAQAASSASSTSVTVAVTVVGFHT